MSATAYVFRMDTGINLPEKADLVIGSNDEDGIAEYLAATFLSEVSNDKQGR